MHNLRQVRLSPDVLFYRKPGKIVAFQRKRLAAIEIDHDAEILLESFRVSKAAIELTPAIVDLIRLGFLIASDVPSDQPKVSCARPIVSAYRLVLTEACNYNCSYCFEHDTTRRQSSMNREILKKAVERIVRQHKPSDSLNIHWFGGEPLLKIDLIRYGVELFNLMISERRLARVSYDLTTHGGLVTEPIAEFFRLNDFRVLVSMDGGKQFNDENRIDKKGRGTFDAAAQGYRLLNDSGVDVGIIVTPVPSSLHRLASGVADIVSLFGPRRIHINNPQPTQNGWDLDGRQLAEQLFAVSKFCKDRDIDLVGPDQKIVRALALREAQELDCVAPNGNMALSVGPNGTLGFCIVSWNDARHNSPDWSMESAEVWKTTDHKTDICKKCPAEAVCGGPCPLEAQLVKLNEQRCRFYLRYLEMELLE